MVRNQWRQVPQGARDDVCLAMAAARNVNRLNSWASDAGSGMMMATRKPSASAGPPDPLSARGEGEYEMGERLSRPR